MIQSWFGRVFARLVYRLRYIIIVLGLGIFAYNCYNLSSLETLSISDSILKKSNPI